VTVPGPVPLPALQRQLRALVNDLRVQAHDLPEVRAWLDKQYQAANASRRTGAVFEVWLEEQLDQAAVAWLLGTVFVRFCEDNDLVSRVWLAGPGDRTEAAAEAQTAYFMQHPLHNDRHWMLTAFSHLRELRATAGIFGDGNPVWKFPISGDAAADLVDFWRRGAGVHSFVDESLDTRFLGDLYQDLSQEARKRYALLQTPEFVEEFILDLTLKPSLDEYGLAETSLIDPTCGSGHFLLGAFERLHERWKQEAPDLDRRVRVQQALDQVTGVDINPFAVAIAKFRLMVAALKACKESSLERAPGFRFRLATGDSLLPWDVGSVAHQGDLVEMAAGREAFAYFTEDADLLADYLRPGQYTVAVGNPPYITVKDNVLNARYREDYDTCSGKYALSVPFVQRFFQLVRPRENSERAGFVGQITANSFMKREFGKKLIEDFFAREVELSHVIDTSGAYIPGHGTPTVILVGRPRYPKLPTVRAVLGILGEPSAPKDPTKGLVWTAIAENIECPGVQNPYVTVADIPRAVFTSHPWSLSGGGAGDLLTAIESAGRCRLDDLADSLGIMSFTLEDDLYMQPAPLLSRVGILAEHVRPMVLGDGIRDWERYSGNLSV
jgi:SAM-dependent methyltransferase